MKIFEYKPNLGGISLGLERFSSNEVVEVANLSKIAAFSYNNTHKQWFFPNFSTIDDYKLEKKCDLAILNPFMGEKISGRGKFNFTEADLRASLGFLEREMPEFALINVDSNAIPLLNHADSYVRDGFDQLSKDIVVDRLQNMGYRAHLVAIDEADYGVPMHKHIAMYIATPNDFELKFPKAFFSRYGRGKYRRYRTIADAIGDLGHIGEWVPYLTDAQNVYQRYIRRGMERVTWNFMRRKLSEGQKDAIKEIRQGSNANKTKTIRQNSGYNRPKWDRICPSLYDDFYTISSRGPSLHPQKNRPFTIREGMRIAGLPDNISFELSVSNRDAAKVVVNSISPIIGEAVAIALRAI